MATEKRLIDVASAWKTAQKIFTDTVLLFAIKRTLDETTTVDAVEVVRCRDCKHYANYGRVWDCQKYGCMSLPNEDDFCSYGERKDNEQP